MIMFKRATLSTALLVAVSIGVAGCDTMGSAPGVGGPGQPQPLSPVASSNVATASLPPLGGAGAPQSSAVQPGLTGTPVLGGVQNENSAPLPPGDPNFVSLADVNTSPPMPGDLSGPLSIERLAGGWTVTGNATTCRLNLSNSAKEGTTRFRASTPGCQIAGLANVASWTLAGTQVQLYDSAGTMIAGLLKSGERFTGTVAGGTLITMQA